MSSEPTAGVGYVNATRMVLNRSLSNLVYLARRLNLSSADGYTSYKESMETALPERFKLKVDSACLSSATSGDGKPNPKRKIVRTTSRGSRFVKTEAHPRTPRGVQCLTANLPVPPPPPPPSPRCPQARELCLALEMSDNLLIQYSQTDELLDQLICDAKDLQRQVAMQCQLQRDIEMTHNIESEFGTRSMRYLIEAIQADFESEHVKKVRQRCLCSLRRFDERQLQMGSEEDDQDQDQSRDEGNGKGTQTDIYQYQGEVISALVDFDLPMDECKSDELGSGDNYQNQKNVQNNIQEEAQPSNRIEFK
ncbi:uncharacterized protein LOC108103265 [Drosophila eugracilis]|uniref:uncharacterized protein LOC108103265 n=1 Tax=Drosophila eugracilis TaxID=29029 RepID=UPI0007E75F07|nr:uncharacterized protein LOC108103265 [Drosophila eugracilis]